MAGTYLGFPSNFTFATPHPQTGLKQLPGKDFFVLFPNGQVRRNLPCGGLDQFSQNQDRKAYPGNWGTYTASKERIVFHWGESKVDFVAPRKKNAFDYQNDRYVRLPVSSVCLDGTYRRADGMSPEFNITFHPDGTFQETGIIGPFIALDNYKIPGEGTYFVRNHSLYLDYVDGRERKISCLMLASGAGKTKANTVLLNTYALARGSTTAPHKPTIAGVLLAKGDPPLTKAMADRVVAYYAWLMDLKLNSDQRDQMRKYIVEYWTTSNSREIENTIGVLREKEVALSKAQHVQNCIRSNAQQTVLPLWRKSTDDPLSIYMADIYDSQHGKESRSH